MPLLRAATTIPTAGRRLQSSHEVPQDAPFAPELRFWDVYPMSLKIHHRGTIGRIVVRTSVDTAALDQSANRARSAAVWGSGSTSSARRCLAAPTVAANSESSKVVR